MEKKLSANSTKKLSPLMTSTNLSAQKDQISARIGFRGALWIAIKMESVLTEENAFASMGTQEQIA